MHSSYCGQNYIYIELAKCDQTQLACLCIGREKEREGERERGMEGITNVVAVVVKVIEYMI